MYIVDHCHDLEPKEVSHMRISPRWKTALGKIVGI